MHIAIIGSGFAGLATAWFLARRECQVTLFDPKGIGGGASGIAAGLIHPYVGEQGRRSLLATEGMAASQTLFEISQSHVEKKIILSRGIKRYTLEELQFQTFTSHIQTYADVEYLGGNQFLISSGMTIDCTAYLEGLWRAVEKRGARLSKTSVASLGELSSFDQVVIAAGAGVLGFEGCESLKVSPTRGQVLKCRLPEPFLQSCICKGYLAVSDNERICYIGSTYEKENLFEEADRDVARRELFPKIALFYPEVEQLEIMDCKAAVRMGSMGHYAPILKKVRPGVWVFTGLGSRGLLYHAHCADALAGAIADDDEEGIPLAFQRKK